MVERLQLTILSIFTRLKGLLKMEGNDPSKKDEDEDENEDSNANQEKKDDKEDESDKDQTPPRDICPLSGNPKR